MFQTKVVDKIEARVLYSTIFFPNLAFYEQMWKPVVEPGRQHDSMAHLYCRLDSEGYKHTLRI
jgi:hypothetical protein